jgi:pimeloyl-ACP methyl ester carboxylesterase
MQTAVAASSRAPAPAGWKDGREEGSIHGEHTKAGVELVTVQTRLFLRKSFSLVTFHVRRIGSGPALVLVHGSIQNSVTWAGQMGLVREYTLVLPDRPGYAPNAPLERIDFDEQAAEVASLLGNGAHLAGFSYGGVITLLAAGLRADAVRSLTVIEPPCFGVARGHPAVEETVAAYEAVWSAGIDDPREFAARFAAVFGAEGRVPADIQPGQEQGVMALMAERAPWEAEIPLDRLAAAAVPTLVCSSGGHPAYEAVCDELERRLGAERAVLPGAGHAVHRAPGFNERFAEFLRSV